MRSDRSLNPTPRRSLAGLVLAVAALLWRQADAAGVQPQRSCKPRAAQCQEWIVVLRPGTDPVMARDWMAAQRVTVGKQLDDLNLLYVWLDAGDRSARLRALIRTQPWVMLLTDQATPQPE
jgi:hypothetical protein